LFTFNYSFSQYCQPTQLILASAMDTRLIIRQTVLSWTPNKSPDTFKNSQFRKIVMQLKSD
jgi:hypothetical protein